MGRRSDLFGHHKCLRGRCTCSYAPQIHQQDFERTHIFGYANLVQANLHEPYCCRNSTRLGKRKGPLIHALSTCRFPRSKWRLLQPNPQCTPSVSQHTSQCKYGQARTPLRQTQDILCPLGQVCPHRSYRSQHRGRRVLRMGARSTRGPQQGSQRGHHP